MTIQSLYTSYRIMPNLQTHMYRVAAVAAQICEASSGKIDQHHILEACLLHDMGNIIKFELDRFSEFLEPEGLLFWQGVQKDFVKKYGSDETVSTMQIADEIGISARTRELLEAIGFHQIQADVANPDLSAKICEYADARVTPFGVVSLQERLQDLKNRYTHRYNSAQDQERRQKFAILAEELEKQIFEHSSITPGEVNDSSIAPNLEELRNFEIRIV